MKLKKTIDKSPVLQTTALVVLFFALSSCSGRHAGDDLANDSSSEKDANPVAEQESTKLKIVNWNVLYGFNHHKSIDEGIGWISNQKPQVVALQELNGETGESLVAKAERWEHKYSALLKEDGFPVGLTSTEPIEVIERRVKGCHHGFLHCKTHGIHFFVVHFWPNKLFDVNLIIEKVKKLNQAGADIIVLGDFNTHSRKDDAFLSKQDRVKPIYEVVDMFEKEGMVDLGYKHSPNSKFSCPSPITIPRWSDNLEVLKSKRQRIDFIFASKSLAGFSSTASIEVSEELDRISDHYPVIAELELPEDSVTNTED